MLEKSLLKDIWSVTVALFFVGAICGSLSINGLAEKLGRKRALIFTYILSYISLFLAILSYFINAFELYAFIYPLDPCIYLKYLPDIFGVCWDVNGIAVQLGI
uniref:Major facilitator superfamily (MFS) profile domain-containing protein n=1 Tax=Panagrolaimus superbus TaxID=310955 RepID=A0A914Y972_9BILA